MIERTMPIDRMENIISVFGSFDQNLRIIESELRVSVTDRDDQLRIAGEAEDVMAAEKAINGLLQLASRGEAIDAQNVRYILKLVSEGRESKIGELGGDVVCILSLIHILLDSCGIPYVKRFPHYGGFGNLMLGMSAEGVDIFVPETMLEEAKNILEGESEDEEL